MFSINSPYFQLVFCVCVCVRVWVCGCVNVWMAAHSVGFSSILLQSDRLNGLRPRLSQQHCLQYWVKPRSIVKHSHYVLQSQECADGCSCLLLITSGLGISLCDEGIPNELLRLKIIWLRKVVFHGFASTITVLKMILCVNIFQKCNISITIKDNIIFNS